MAGLITQDLLDISLADSTTGWAGTSGQLDTEVYKQAVTIGTDGAYTYQTGKSGIETCTFTPAANINMTANYTTPHLYWTMKCDVFPFCELLNTGATNSGLMIRVDDGAGAWVQWHVAGRDTWDGGWKNFVLDLTNTANVHSSSGTLSLADVDIISFITDNSNSGNIRIIDNTWLDAVRYGDGLQAESTTTEAFAFTDIALDDGLTANYYGVQQQRPDEEVLFTQGGIIIGDSVASATANFISLNEQIVFIDRIVSGTHYKITGVASATATTDIDIQGLICKTTGLSGIRADFDFTDVNLNSLLITDSTFGNMGTFKYQTGGDCRRNKYVNCDQITPDGADIRDSILSGYEGTADTGYIIYDDTVDPDGEFDGTTITKGSALTHAIEFGINSPLTMTLRDMVFSGYNAADTNTDSTFLVRRTTGTVTINIIGGSGNVTYKSLGAIVDVVQNPVTTKITVKDIETQNAIIGARVLVTVADGANFPYEDSVTITRVSATASVAHTAHGLVNGDKITIRGVDQWEYKGVKTISNVTTNAYDFTVTGTPTTPATGTITSTMVIIDEDTIAGGIADDTRTFSADQLIVGRVRHSSTAPYYKNAPITGTILAASGFSATIQMIPD